MNGIEKSSEFRAAKILLKILDLGGKFSKEPEGISCMLNDLKYYSLELRLDEECYYIQAYERDAIELYNAVTEIQENKI